MAVIDRYTVIGHPIAHSRSPRIHSLFAQATGHSLQYDTTLAPLDGFAATVAALQATGGKGANVTLPFKQQAFALATRSTARAQLAGAANTLRFDADGIFADTTDGVGLLHDLIRLLAADDNDDPTHSKALQGLRVLLLGAGGAVRGVLPALSQAGAQLFISSRDDAKSQALVAQMNQSQVVCHALPWASVALAATERAGSVPLTLTRHEPNLPFAVIVNGTSAGMGQAELGFALAPHLWQGVRLAYDMQYRAGLTPFCAAATQAQVACADGLGMLVAQAAESFYLWRGVRPAIAPVLAALRQA